MFCPTCGKEVSEGDAFCRSCGRPLSEDKSVSTEPVPGKEAASAVERPEQPPRRSGEATASLVLGLFSFIPVVGLLAVIFGHLAMASIRRSGGRMLGEGMAGIGLVLGYLGLAGWVIYGLTFLVHPFLPSTERAENEKIAVEDLATLNTAAVTYTSMYDHGYPPNLAALGPPETGDPNATSAEIVKAEGPNAAGLIDQDLALGAEDDYRFTYTAGAKNKGRIDTYTIHADPVTPGVTGENHFFTDESEVIRFEVDEPADASSLPVADLPQ
ncbi:MAG: DUF4190 domain-containing protein [Terriglobia bacterium]